MSPNQLSGAPRSRKERARFVIKHGRALLLVFLFVYAAACQRTNVPDKTSPDYAAAVRAFYVGLAALQVGDDVRAEARLKEATRVAPDEPAAWADLGLLYLRQRELERAAEQLEKARQLAPESAHVHVLVGLLESTRGRYAEAIAALRRAVELDPKDLKALYALAAEVEREGGEAGETETFALLKRILEASPDNVAVMLDLARLAAKRGDAETLRSMVARLEAKASAWPPEVLEQFKLLQTAAAGDNVRAAAPRVQFLRNVLARVPEYRQSLAAVKLPAEIVGEPLTRPLKLEAPRPAPAPADEATTFEVAPPNAPDCAPCVLAGVLYLDSDAKPVRFVSDGAELKLESGAVLQLPGGTRGGALAGDNVLALDFDYDFKNDLVLTSAGGFRLFKQEDGGRFADVTARTKLSTGVNGARYRGAWAADIEADGDLDIVLGAEGGDALVLQNNGDGTFAETRPFAGARDAAGFAWGDFDADGDVDAAVLNASGALKTYANERAGLFRERPTPTVETVAAVSAADVNDDGRLDLVALHANGAVRAYSDKSEGREWTATELGAASGSSATAGGARLFVADVDNNGALDVVASGLSGNEVTRAWLHEGSAVWKPLGLRAEAAGARVFAVSDVNNDGRLDLVGVSSAAPSSTFVATNRGAKSYHWQVIRPRAQEATGDQRINSFGVGGEIEVRAGLLTQKQSITSPLVHFGLGTETQTDVARITWPNGVLQAEFELKADAAALAEQRLKGSCPWVFAFDGERVSFVTDTLWRSPLGLKINAQDTAGVMMTEEWIKIRGDQLKPRGGFYDLRITAELWETHFFDHVSLMVVDHPAGTEVFVDERFAVPPPALKVYATAQPKAFAAAVDDDGRDVSSVVREQDGKYLDNFGRGRYQGITREHFVELELPEDAPREEPLWLVGAGWIHPTDSSINVAVSQGAQVRPQGLSLEVADGSGGWTTALPALGFPAGKNKTVLIDLTNVFRPNAPRRLRLKTNLEIFWDKLAWATGSPTTELKTERLVPESAELRYRGYSVVSQADKSSPELPDYERLAGAVPVWRDLVGYHTRFGDVRELLKTVDDRYVIMNAGDEMLFRFAAGSAPPAGWVRDFVLVCDGWEKDGDYNTTFSKTVLPLPTHASADYTETPTRLEDDPVYRKHEQDWQDYHTRYVTPRAVHDALRQR